ncbi:hypothetical protein KIW84_057342 [Lathyrus oleraceus]|uniref:Uncharacterized protein n=1 Tax=Pisum sativum TaxID=3888 RepID=A0A9D5AMF6_PEA|nr:hypothetical protein KIW84_057342 [Pisum sativum]
MTLKERKVIREGFESRIKDLTRLLQEAQTRTTHETRHREEIKRTLRSPHVSLQQALTEVERLRSSNQILKDARETMKKEWSLKTQQWESLAQRDCKRIYYARLEANTWFGKCEQVIELANSLLHTLPLRKKNTKYHFLFLSFLASVIIKLIPRHNYGTRANIKRTMEEMKEDIDGLKGEMENMMETMHALTNREDPPQRTVISKTTGPSLEPQPPPRVNTTWPEFGLPPHYSPSFADSFEVGLST